MSATIDANPAVSAEVSIEVAMPADPARVWTALVDEIDRWWPDAFYLTPEPRRIALEARPGGRLAEESDTGAGLLWYVVIALEPRESLQLAGHIFPAFGGPATSFVQVRISPAPGGSVLALTDSLIGRIEAGSPPMIESGWRSIFETGLRAYLEAEG